MFKVTTFVLHVASVTDFDQPVTLMFTGLRMTSWPIMQRRRGMDLTAFIM